MTSTKPILLFAPAGVWTRQLAAALEGIGVPVEHVDDPTGHMSALVSEPALLADAPACVIFDLQGEGEGAWKDQRSSLEVCASAWSNAHPRLHSVVLSDVNDKAAVLAILRRDWVSHLIPRSTSGSMDEILLVARSTSGGLPFGFPDRLVREVEPVSHPIRTSRDKDRLLDALDECTASHNINQRIANAARMVADEFIVNAVYNAPIDDRGQRPYHARDRKIPVDLPEGDEGRFAFACNGRVLAISVFDRFGSLSPEVLRRNLVRGMEGGPGQIDQKAGGAGLGMLYILNSTNKLLINIHPGEGTEFTATFSIGGSFRAFASQPKSFHLFERRG